MPLYIKDQEVSDLADAAVKALGAENKTEAVRMALKSAIAAVKRNTPLLTRLEAVRRLADDIGPINPGYDHKSDMDELWGK